MSTGLALRHRGLTTAGALPIRSVSQRRGVIVSVSDGNAGVGGGGGGKGGGGRGGAISSRVMRDGVNRIASCLRRFGARGAGDTRPVFVHKTAARAAADDSANGPTTMSVEGEEAPAPVGGGIPFKRFHGAKLMMEDSVFAELELQEASQKVAGVRVRQHVNPLKMSLQVQAPTPAWSEVFASTARPLVVDIGCGGGRFDLMMAKRYPEKNVLGVDIRAPLVERGNAWGAHAGIVDNLHFAECNATVSIGKWLASYAEASDARQAVELVTIQFPDPHFKTRHHKRRVVQPALVRAVAQGLTSGARVFLQSDVREVSEDMRDKFERFGAHLFALDADLHDVAALDAPLLEANAAAAMEAAAAAFEVDERARVNREAAEAGGPRGRDRRRGPAARGGGGAEGQPSEPSQPSQLTPGEERGEESSEQRQRRHEATKQERLEGEGEGGDGSGGVTDEDGGEGGRWTSAWAAAGPPGRGGWLDDNPLGVPTEREVQTTSTGGRCYRVMLVRNDTPVSP